MLLEEGLLEDAALQLCNLRERAEPHVAEQPVAVWPVVVRPVAVRPEIAPVPFAAGGAGRVQLQKRLKLAPVVPSAALHREQPEQAEQPGLQPEQPGLESAGQDASVEAPLLVRSFPPLREGVACQPKLVRAQEVCASVLAEKLQIDTTTITNYKEKDVIETVYVNWTPCEQDQLFNVRDVVRVFVRNASLSASRSANEHLLAQMRKADYPSMEKFPSRSASSAWYIDIKDLSQLLIKHSVKVGNSAAAGAAPAAPPEPGQEQAITLQVELRPDQEVTVNIDSAQTQITTSFFFAGDITDVFRVDTSDIDDFDKNAVIRKVVQGLLDVQGKWDLCTVMMAFDPSKWRFRRNAVRALAKTSIADYPSRTEVQMAHNNVSLLNFLYQSY
jgi:hypothetical protein